MKILSDGGSTKVEWVLSDKGQEIMRCTSKGINPSLLSKEEITAELELVVRDNPELLQATEIEYYGAGCTPSASPIMKNCLRSIFSNTTKVIVGSDIIGAAKALLGNSEGIACILGTGANSCLWNGHDIVRQTPALGFILGDEGSGAVLGKLLVNALYKGMLPQTLREAFEQEYQTNMMDVISHVYRQPQPNRWLASLSPFVYKHLDVPEMEQLVCTNLEAFIMRNILPYQRPELAVSFVGSIAYYYERQLRKVAERHNILIGKIIKSPL